MKLRTGTFLALGVLVALLLAGVASWYASGSPDGLEKVAEDKGFLSSAEDHGLADSPFAGYATKGVDSGRLSGGLAGVAGVGATLLIGGVLFTAVRRRPSATSVTAASGTATSGTATPGTASRTSAAPGTATPGTAAPGTASRTSATSAPAGSPDSGARAGDAPSASPR